jgi:phospholipase/carboxylesterase
MTPPVIVALHGVGSNAEDMAAALAPLNAFAEVIALPGHEPFDAAPRGRQWFSVAGVTEANRSARTAAALPELLARLDSIAADRGRKRDDLVLLGFSQGAIMTLAAVAGGHFRGRAIAVAGRLAAPIDLAPAHRASLLVIHDADDGVMPSSLSLEAVTALCYAGHEIDIVGTSGVGHRIGGATLDAIGTWLARHPEPTRLSAALQG